MRQQPDQMIEKARRLLNTWGDWLRATPGIDNSVTSQYNERSSIGYREVLPDNETAARVEVILCRVKQNWPQVYAVLYSRYYYDRSCEEVANTQRIGIPTVKSWQRLGEVSVASYWDAGYGVDKLLAIKKSA